MNEIIVMVPVKTKINNNTVTNFQIPNIQDVQNALQYTKTTIVIEISGGNCQKITSNQPANITLIDYDNIEAGDQPTTDNFPPTVNPNKINEIYNNITQNKI